MYPRSKRRVFRRRRRPAFRRRKFKRPCYKRRRGRTVTRRRRRRRYAVRSVCCPVQIFTAPARGHSVHLSDCTKWNVSDIPLAMMSMWGYMYEQVKFLKVTFKYWPLDIYEEIMFDKQVTTQMLRMKGRTPELRYSYDPDCKTRTMTANNIMKRRNALIVVFKSMSEWIST